jgi:hypothetical protein
MNRSLLGLIQVMADRWNDRNWLTAALQSLASARPQYGSDRTFAHISTPVGRSRRCHGPSQSNGMCLAELVVQCHLKPKASTIQTVGHRACRPARRDHRLASAAPIHTGGAVARPPFSLRRNIRQGRLAARSKRRHQVVTGRRDITPPASRPEIPSP